MNAPAPAPHWNRPTPTPSGTPGAPALLPFPNRRPPFFRPPPPPPPRVVSPWIDYLDDLVASGGPEPEEHPRLHRCFAEIARAEAADPTGVALATAARQALAPTLLRATLLGYAHLRPHGYPGDFELLERILSFHHSTDPNLVRWDAFGHALPVVRALRNRAAHLREHLRRLESETPGEPARILHFRSGPGRELADYFIAHGATSRLRADCVDPDPDAAPHGRRNVARMTDRLTFHASPLLRFRTPHRYRLAWVSGLCEAIPDRAFVVVLRRLLRLLEPGGRVVCCQLSEPDATAPVLEVLAGWRLEYRDAATLRALAERAGAAPGSIRVECDPQYPNLFLHVTAPATAHRGRRPVRIAGTTASTRIERPAFGSLSRAA